eukprot:COSAG06_NODE_16858_length_977_cov_0.796128_3_plen_78_part_00
MLRQENAPSLSAATGGGGERNPALEAQTGSVFPSSDAATTGDAASFEDKDGGEGVSVENPVAGRGKGNKGKKGLDTE